MLKMKLVSTYNSELKKSENNGYKKGYMEACEIKNEKIDELHNCFKASENIRINTNKKLQNTILEVKKCKIHIKHQSKEIDSLNLILFNTNNILKSKTDRDIKYLEIIMKKCKKGRVKNKYKNKILKLITKRLMEEGEFINE